MIELVLRVLCSLTVVFVLLWALARLARRGGAGRGGGVLTVLARQQLSRGSSVAVVKVADRALVLGVSDAGVSLLADADAHLFDQPVEASPPALLAGSLFSADLWRFLRGRR
jgi:flagellar biosynthetic protein FliO